MQNGHYENQMFTHIFVLYQLRYLKMLRTFDEQLVSFTGTQWERASTLIPM